MVLPGIRRPGGLQRSKDAREEPDWESEPLDVEDAISRYLT
jgi:hypothetical protein